MKSLTTTQVKRHASCLHARLRTKSSDPGPSLQPNNLAIWRFSCFFSVYHAENMVRQANWGIPDVAKCQFRIGKVSLARVRISEMAQRWNTCWLLAAKVLHHRCQPGTCLQSSFVSSGTHSGRQRIHAF